MDSAVPRQRLQSATPLFLVSNLQRAIDFYSGKLGFTRARWWGEPPSFAIVDRDGFEVMLKTSDESWGDAKPNGTTGSWDLYLRVGDVAAEMATLRAAAVVITREPEDMFYGMREIEVRDPDGHLICLAQDLSMENDPHTGDWSGTLDLRSAKLRLVLKVRRASDGRLSGALDSLDQNALNLPIDQLGMDGPTLRFQMRAINAEFEGTFEANRLSGHWNQMGHSWPLTLIKE